MVSLVPQSVCSSSNQTDSSSVILLLEVRTQFISVLLAFLPSSFPSPLFLRLMSLFPSTLHSIALFFSPYFPNSSTLYLILNSFLPYPLSTLQYNFKTSWALWFFWSTLKLLTLYNVTGFDLLNWWLCSTSYQQLRLIYINHYHHFFPSRCLILKEPFTSCKIRYYRVHHTLVEKNR